MRTVVLGVLLAWGVAAAAPAPTPPAFTVADDHIDATITGGPRVPLADIALESERGERVTALAVHDEPIAVAVVVQGNELMMGNESMIADGDDTSRYRGYLGPLNTALAALDLAPGSQVVVVTYADAAVVRMPLGAPAGLVDKPLGTERDYYARIGSELVAGVTLGLAELRAATAKRKVLLVIGDGNDTNNDAAKPRLAELARQAGRQGVQLEALIYKSAVSSDGDVVGQLGIRPQTVDSADGMGPAVIAVVTRAKDRYTATFPTVPGAHELALTVGGERIGSLSLAAAIVPASGPSGWAQLGMAIIFVAGMTLFLRYGASWS